MLLSQAGLQSRLSLASFLREHSFKHRNECQSEGREGFGGLQSQLGLAYPQSSFPGSPILGPAGLPLCGCRQHPGRCSVLPASCWLWRVAGLVLWSEEGQGGKDNSSRTDALIKPISAATETVLLLYKAHRAGIIMD